MISPKAIRIVIADDHLVVREGHVERTHRILQASNATVTRHRYPGDAHLIFPEEIEWIRNELIKISARR